jgi:hypothetical protein
MTKLIFGNGYHNGDIHLSRSFIRVIVNHFKQYEYYYTHNNGIELLKDIPVTYDPGLIKTFPPDNTLFTKTDEQITLNTWYGARNFDFLNRHGLSFDCLYDLFDDFCRNALGLTLEDLQPNPQNLFPKIDFSFYKTDKIDDYVKADDRRKVFISNGHTLSGQAHNFNFDPIIEKLADKYHGIVFLCSNLSQVERDNVLFTRNIIGQDHIDLCENAYLSTFCPVIVGRSSGTFSFAFIQENLFGTTPKKMISYSNLHNGPGEYFWLGNKFKNKIKYTTQMMPSIITSTDLIYQMLEREVLP